MRKLLVLVYLFGFLIGGCGPMDMNNSMTNPDPVAQITGTMANTLIMTKSTVISVMTSISDSCKIGILPADTCKKAEDLYLKIQPAINAAEQSVIVSATTGDLTKINANQAAINSMVAELMELKGDK